MKFFSYCVSGSRARPVRPMKAAGAANTHQALKSQDSSCFNTEADHIQLPETTVDIDIQPIAANQYQVSSHLSQNARV